MLNISTRGYVATGEGVMIAGMIIGGTETETLVFRGLGPSVAAGTPPISDTLPDPTLMLVDAQGTTLFTNNDWQDTQAAEIVDTGLAPPDAQEAAILITFAPGNYTALLSDAEARLASACSKSTISQTARRWCSDRALARCRLKGGLLKPGRGTAPRSAAARAGWLCGGSDHPAADNDVPSAE